MSGSELWPRKVELTHAHSKNATTTESILHATTKPVSVLTKTSFIAVIFISQWSLLDYHLINKTHTLVSSKLAPIAIRMVLP